MDQQNSLTAEDYKQLLDSEMQDFVAATNAAYPPDAVERSIAEQRKIYDRMAHTFRAPRPAGVTVEDLTLPGPLPVPLRRYRASAAAEAAVLYLHGGGFVVGGLDSHDDVCAEICARTGFEVVSIDYRLSPEHAHPAAFDDARAAARWLCGRGLPVVLAGDSAGGNLAAAVCHALRAEPARPVGQVLIYAGLGSPEDLPSYIRHAYAPMLTLADIRFYADIRGPGGRNDPTMSPLADDDFTGLPPTVLLPADCDPLRDDSVVYDSLIRVAGGRSACLIQTGWLHGGLRARHRSQVARRAFDDVVEAIAVLGRGGWIW